MSPNSRLRSDSDQGLRRALWKHHCSAERTLELAGVGAFHLRTRRSSGIETAEPKKKLTVNIGSIKDQFEKENVNEATTSPIKSPLPQVNKLNHNVFEQKSVEEDKVKRKKEYVPIIIDRDAFERTKCSFEKEKREEEERQNQIR